MPQRDHLSLPPLDPQSSEDQDWQRLVEERLPADLEAQARQLKAFQRVRGLPSALHLLLRVGDIVVGDGAYSRAKQLLAVAAAGAFSLVRYSAAHLPLYAPAAPAWTREHRLDVPAWLRTLPPGLYERQAMVVDQANQ